MIKKLPRKDIKTILYLNSIKSNTKGIVNIKIRIKLKLIITSFFIDILIDIKKTPRMYYLRVLIKVFKNKTFGYNLGAIFAINL